MAEQPLSGLKLFNRGKVRDIYDLGDKLLLVASDRISAFDVILPTLIPDKGKILTRLSEFWFGIIKKIVVTVAQVRNVSVHARGRVSCSMPAAQSRARRPLDVGEEEYTRTRRMHRARLSRGIRLERLSTDWRGLRHSVAARTGRGIPARSADLHTVDQGARRRP